MEIGDFKMVGAAAPPKVSLPDGSIPPANLPLTAEHEARMAAGGMVNGQYFPRRNGGIMPHEGSGQKDDVPAMLMAGEFVLTKDAVKGLGNGDQNRGIQKAYRLMDKLEDMA